MDSLDCGCVLTLPVELTELCEALDKRRLRCCEVGLARGLIALSPEEAAAAGALPSLLSLTSL